MENVIEFDWQAEQINELFNGDGPFASVSTEEIAVYANDYYKRACFANLPESMMNEWVQQDPVYSRFGTYRNFVAWQAVANGAGAVYPEGYTSQLHLDTTGYQEAELAGVRFRNFSYTFKVGKVYEESMLVEGYCDIAGGDEFECYKASERMYYNEDTKDCMHIDITHVIEAFDDDELGAYYFDHHRKEYDGEMRLVTDGEAYCATSGDMSYVQFNKPGYYRITTVVTNNVTREDLGTGYWISHHYAHVTE